MKNKAKWIGIVCGTLHLLFVIYLIHLILNGNEPDWPVYWLILIPFNLPTLLLIFITGRLLEPVFEIIASNFSTGTPLGDATNFWIPFFYFGILGTIMWYFLPSWIVILIAKIKNR